VFLMHNVHDQAGSIMLHTRWAMSYLRGPLTRQQVQILMADQKAARGISTPAASATPATASPGPGFASQMVAQQSNAPTYNPPPAGLPVGAPPSLPEFPAPSVQTSAIQPASSLDNTMPITPQRQIASTQTSALGLPAPSGYSDRQPPVTASVAQYFLPAVISSQQAIADWEHKTNFAATAFGGVVLAYRPFLLAQVSVRYQDRKTQVYSTRQFAYLISDVDQAGIVRWAEAETRPLDSRQLSGEPFASAFFGDLPPGLTDAKRLTALRREILDVVYNTKGLQVPYSPALGIYGNPDVDFATFRSQLQQTVREKRDAEMDALTAKYEQKIDRIEEQKQRKMQRRDSEKRELSKLKREQLFTNVEAGLGLLRGRTSFTLSRMSRAAVYKERSQGQLDLHELDLQQLEDEEVKIRDEFAALARDLNERWARTATNIEQYQITPYKKDINLDLFGIGWLPFWYAWVNNQPLLLPALG
ncbi:MAG: hypothetical protein ABI835_05925, partial [Chloroflexota bacterium]